MKIPRNVSMRIRRCEANGEIEITIRDQERGSLLGIAGSDVARKQDTHARPRHLPDAAANGRGLVWNGRNRVVPEEDASSAGVSTPGRTLRRTKPNGDSVASAHLIPATGETLGI